MQTENEREIIHSVPEREIKETKECLIMADTKTRGIFKITSNFNPQFQYIGASKQIEVVFKDYLKWCERGVAPKDMQDEFNRHKGKKGTTPDKVFKCVVVALAVTDDQLNTLREQHCPKRGFAAGKKDEEVGMEIQPSNAVLDGFFHANKGSPDFSFTSIIGDISQTFATRRHCVVQRRLNQAICTILRENQPCEYSSIQA